MKRFHPLRYLAVLGLLPAFAMVFWMTALLASHVPGLLILGVNVHGLGLANYAADSALRPAAVSLRVGQDARQDAGVASPSTTTPSQTASPTPTALPLPTVSPVPLPLPTPSPLPLPLPTPTPLPTLTPVPTTTPGPIPVPTPTPTPTPTPLLPLPLPAPIPILPSVLPGILK